MLEAIGHKGYRYCLLSELQHSKHIQLCSPLRINKVSRFTTLEVNVTQPPMKARNAVLLRLLLFILFLKEYARKSGSKNIKVR